MTAPTSRETPATARDRNPGRRSLATLTARGRVVAAGLACAAAFAVGVYAEPLGLVGWWLP